MNKKIITTIIFFILIIFISQVDVFGVDITSEAGVLIDFNSAKEIYSKSSNQKMYPASLTKILTAIVVIENCDINKTAIVSKTAIDSVEFGYVTANLKEGEEVKVEELLNVLLVASSNDVAYVLAEYVSGNINDFCNLMNLKAKEIGCKNSNFTNPCGKHEENHYSTAYDLSLIARNAMKNEKIAEIINKTYYLLNNTNKYSGTERVFSTTNEFIMSGSANYYKYATGIKTGFTTPAGQCLISYAEKDGIKLIGVILNATTSENRYNDMKSIFEWGFENYSIQQIGNIGDTVQTINVKNATYKTKKLNLILGDNIEILINNQNTKEKLLPKIELKENLKAPIKQGEIVGRISYNHDGIEYSANLIASKNVEMSFLLFYIIILFVFIVVLLIIIRLIIVRKKRFIK